ncbi:hypothetical protein BABINDRAFT_34104 [Babjeviella inositovora NRRL Y-12698]|uniref:HORMA domain-containing protein n=1 Tax=Babjeviella inositovora NRRL Y-12698 TaxID=984486 RepID=A0A1E3QTP5_9ASCO|nr:uncharacterized protein BABINDRAFT_34104 [Babjeviella inositovora NRRL Y-12698]ODQ80914.1 hypothetical protein BABINDRAFT_34104 [Babjeviella inositovora NRRL Y-12698]
MSSAPTRSTVSLKGSSKIVADFFEYSINSILYQRGIYPPEDFITVKKYGLNMVITHDDDIKKYIRKILSQLHKWLMRGNIDKLIVAIVNKDDYEAVERWQFDVKLFSNTEPREDAPEKLYEDVQREIQAIIRQITASVTFLPILSAGNYTFNVLVYCDPNAQVPTEWIDSQRGGMDLEGRVENVKFKEFSTNEHEIGTLVSYKLNE